MHCAAQSHRSLPASLTDDDQATQSLDPRVIRTRAALRDALLALISKYDFDAISVRDIAREAGVTFPTFYRQFGTKEALLADVAKEEVRTVAWLMGTQGPTLTEIAHRVCQHVDANRTLWVLLLGQGAADVMRAEFVSMTRAHLSEIKRVNPELPADMVGAARVSSSIEILSWWLHQNPDHPIETVAWYLETFALKPAATRHLLPSPTTSAPHR